jgi:hypothetical protein
VFAYHENRVLSIEAGALAFPCEAEATIELCPSPIHGDQVPGSTCALGSQAHMMWNASTGKSLVESDPPLPETAVNVAMQHLALSVSGRPVRARWPSHSLEDLVGTLRALHCRSRWDSRTRRCRW